jgi:RAD51-like protein 3
MPDGAVNPLSNFTSTTRKPALGPTFTLIVDATLWLARTDIVDPNVEEVHTAELFKSRVSVRISFTMP